MNNQQHLKQGKLVTYNAFDENINPDSFFKDSWDEQAIENMVFHEIPEDMNAQIAHRPWKRERFLQEECEVISEPGMMPEPDNTINLECAFDVTCISRGIASQDKNRRRSSSSSSSSSSSDSPLFMFEPTFFLHATIGRENDKKSSFNRIYIQQKGVQEFWHRPELLHPSFGVYLQTDPSIILHRIVGDDIHTFAFENGQGDLFYISAPSVADRQLSLTNTTSPILDIHNDPRCFKYVRDPKMNGFFLRPVANEQICVGVGQIETGRQGRTKNVVKTVKIDKMSPRWRLSEIPS